jgi:hypothetical protein
MEWDTIFHLRIVKKDLLILYELLEFIFQVLGSFTIGISKRSVLSFKGLEKKILILFSICIIIIILDFFMPIDKMMSC